MEIPAQDALPLIRRRVGSVPSVGRGEGCGRPAPASCSGSGHAEPPAPRKDRPRRRLARAADVAAALGLIAFLAPVLAGIALASYRPGAPLILRRHRVLPYGRRVAVFEFSTAGPTGRYLRLFRGDQLPQLFSVLRGELSIFGDPSRPHLFAD